MREAIAGAAEALVPPGKAPLDDALGNSLSQLRDVQLMRHGLTPGDYAELRTLEQRWRTGDPSLDSRLRQAFERRRDRLEQAAVPAYDAWQR